MLVGAARAACAPYPPSVPDRDSLQATCNSPSYSVHSIRSVSSQYSTSPEFSSRRRLAGGVACLSIPLCCNGGEFPSLSNYLTFLTNHITKHTKIITSLSKINSANILPFGSKQSTAPLLRKNIGYKLIQLLNPASMFTTSCVSVIRRSVPRVHFLVICSQSIP